MGDKVNTYSYKLQTDQKTQFLVNTKDDGSFEIMSRIEIMDDGSLIAYEEVLDKEPMNFALSGRIPEGGA